MNILKLFKTLFLAFCIILSNFCMANEILLVSAHGQGGGIHKHALQVQELLTGWLNKPTILEFKPGGNAAVAAQYITTKVTNYPVFMIGLLQYETTVDQTQDIVPVVELGVLNATLFAGNHLGVKNWNQFLTNKKSISYGTPIGGNILYLRGLSRHLKDRIEMIEVPYKSSAQMQTDVIAGHIDIGSATPNVLAPLAAAGQIVPLMVFGPARSISLPDVPTAQELGLSFPEDRFKGRTFLWASKSTDPTVIALVRENYIKWVATPQALQTLASLDYVAPTTLFMTQPAKEIKKLMATVPKN
jgi:tripartite-type tricarboxylate transporter receptor subunit TctC